MASENPWKRINDNFSALCSIPVELPCKIGDHVWCIRSYKGYKHPQDGIVSEMYYSLDMQLCIAVKHIGRGVWGEQIFATREDAVAKILGGNNENRNH